MIMELCSMIGTTPHERMRMWRNWQTHETQNLAVATSCGFKSHHPQEDEKSRQGVNPCLLFLASCGCPQPMGSRSRQLRLRRTGSVGSAGKRSTGPFSVSASPHHPQDAPKPTGFPKGTRRATHAVAGPTNFI